MVSFLLLAALLAFWMLPTMVQALPGQVRVRLPEELLRAVTKPLPTALPAPSVIPAEIQLTVESIVAAPLTISSATPTPRTEQSATPAKTAAPDLPAATPTLAATRIPPTATATAVAIPTAALLQGMEITPQKLNNCGPTNLSLNLNYYGLESTQFDVAGVVKPHYDDRNVSPQELVSYTNNHTDLRASQYSGGDLLLLKQLLAAGFPVVIEKGYEPDWQGWMGHYLTLTGYDEVTSSFLTMDTFLGPWDGSGRPYTYDEIEEKWQHFNNTFFVVYPPQQEEEFLALIGPELGDPLSMWQHTAEQAQQQINTDPENAFAWFNLGSSYSELGEITADPQFHSAAAAAFDQARLIGLPTRMLWYQFQPYVAYLAADRIDDVLTLTATIRDNQGGDKVEETFYYRGRALQAQGNTEDAIYNYRRALELKPHYLEAQGALDAITGS